tara:strand:- start:601 stop:786 length:186 start_codon:yes stop_codon:yes gene_type:complete
MGENKMEYEKIKEKGKVLEEKLRERLLELKMKPLAFVVGPDGLIYSVETTSEAFDKRYFRR